MERIIDVDERIRRAQELYNRRKMQGGIRVSTSNVNNSSRSSFSLFKKMVIKIITCAIIYLIFYILKNSGVIFSKNVLEQTKKMLSYDINFTQVYAQTVKLFNENSIAKNYGFKNKNSIENAGESEQTMEQENTNVTEKPEETGIENDKEGNDAELNKEELGVGGTDIEKTSVDIIENAPAQVAVIQKTQMEIDAEYVKSNISLTKPLQGIVTSRFGPRQPTDIISANHQGIDIGANTGTKIYAAMEGTITNVSNYGDYGKHFSIKNGDVVMLYAHCSKIQVTNGQYVKKGQEIASVGSTGRTTGPHLHFEIKREGRVINPDYVMDF